MGLRWICSIIGFCTLISCQPKYFEIISDQEILDVLAPEIKLEDFEHYTFKLRPAQYFKNNSLTSTLVSDSSQFIKYGQLFNTSPSDFTYTEGYSYLDSSWFSIDVYVENKQYNPRVYIKTLAGKNFQAQERQWMKDHNEEVKNSGAKLSNVYLGYIDSDFGEKEEKRSMVLIDKAFKIGYNHHDLVKSGPSLAFLIRRMESTLIVDAVIDIDFRKKDDKPVMYDMQSIFGEPLWMNKAQD